MPPSRLSPPECPRARCITTTSPGASSTGTRPPRNGQTTSPPFVRRFGVGATPTIALWRRLVQMRLERPIVRLIRELEEDLRLARWSLPKLGRKVLEQAEDLGLPAQMRDQHFASRHAEISDAFSPRCRRSRWRQRSARS